MIKKFLIYYFFLNYLFINATTSTFLWKSTTFGKVNTPVLGNINNDGNIEVVISSTDGTVYAINGIKGNFIWKFSTNNSIVSSPCLKDIDEDEILDVIVASKNGNVYGLKGTNGKLLWKTFCEDEIVSCLACKDINYGGFPEIIVSTQKGKVLCLNAKEGKIQWIMKINEEIVSSPLIIDLNKDTIDDIIISSCNGFVYALNGKNGKPLWTFNSKQKIFLSSTVVIFNKNEKINIIVCSEKTVYSIKGDNGTKLWSYPVKKPFSCSPIAGDFNKNGKNEIVVFLENGDIILLNSFLGTQIWKKELNQKICDGAAIANFNGDNILDIIVGTNNGLIYGLDGKQGNINLEIKVDEIINSGIVIGDVNKDGYLEILIGSDERHLWCFSTSQKVNVNTISWETFQGNASHLANWQEIKKEQAFDFLYKKANFCVKKEKWIESLKLLKKIISIKPYHISAKEKLLFVEKQIELLGLTDFLLTKQEINDLFDKAAKQYNEGKLESALAICKKILKVDTNYLEAKKKVNLIEQKIVQIEKLKKIEEEKKRIEKEIEILYLKAMDLYENHLLEEALLEFEKILKLDSKHILAFEKTKEIKKYISSYDKKTREQIRQHFNFGFKKFKENNWQESLSAFKKVLQIDPNHQNAKKYLEETRKKLLKQKTKIELANFYYNKGIKNIDDQNWIEAKENFEEALFFDHFFQKAHNKIKEVEILQKKSLIKKHYNQGIKYFKLENWIEAIKEFEEILKIDPKHQKTKEKYNIAIKCFEITHGNKKMQNIINEFLNKGNSCLEKKEWEKANTFFTNVLEINENSKQATEGINKANYFKGIELIKKAKFKKAKEKFENILKKQNSFQFKILSWYYFSVFLYYLITKLFFIPVLLIVFAIISFIVLAKKYPNDY